MTEERVRKDRVLKNRVHKNYIFPWERGTINIHAIVDMYPAGNIVTYRMTVKRHGEIIEKNSFASSDSESMMNRIKYFQNLPNK
ncbi:MAG: hypothetical protein ACTSPB_15540 [Candidatus Thorarchaeota archaeon]